MYGDQDSQPLHLIDAHDAECVLGPGAGRPLPYRPAGDGSKWCITRSSRNRVMPRTRSALRVRTIGPAG